MTMIMMTDIYYKYSYQSFYNRPSGKKSRWFSKKPTETKEQETPTTTNEKQTLKEQTLPKIDETSIEHDMESERVNNDRPKEQNEQTLTQEEVTKHSV